MKKKPIKSKAVKKSPLKQKSIAKMESELARSKAQLAQAERELEIESALEKVRARSLAMQKSTELAEVVAVQYEQIASLHLADWGSNISLYKDEAQTFDLWLSTTDQKVLPECYSLPVNGHPILRKQWAIWKERRRGHSITLSGRNKQGYDKYLFASTALKGLPKKVKEGIRSIAQIHTSFAYMKYGLIAAFNLEGPLSAENSKILQRFAKVFEQVYTRFLDLQKAEAQAREAEIELALERVRARTMAMKQSSELRDAGNMVFRQLKALGIEAETSWLWFIDTKKNTLEIWTTHKNKLADPVKVKAADLWTFKKEIDGWKKKKPFLKVSILKKEAIQSIKKVFGIKISSKINATHFHLLQIRHQFGFLGLGTWHEAKEEEQQICSRFAKVFEQTYTRFLDLQKAEAQAREAQIEAALERIRSASMAMHDSNELIKVVRLMDRAIRELEIDINGIQIVTDFTDIKKGMNVWLAVGEVDYLKKFHNPYVDHPTHHSLQQALKDEQQFFTEKYSKVEKNRFLRFLYKHSDFKKIPKERKEFTLDASWWVRSSAINKNSILAFQRYYDKEFDEAENEILKRFGKAFEQSYTRFLDLQKAEAQAREAEMQLALERVRARSLAMHQSDEFADVAVVLFQQLHALGIDLVHSYITITRKGEWVDTWYTEPGGSFNAKTLRQSIKEDVFMRNRAIKAFKKKVPFFFSDRKGRVYKDYIKLLGPKSEITRALRNNLKKNPSPNLYQSSAFFRNGFVGFASFMERKEEDLQVLRRFASVIEQTYTRFLDLQKAEGQAREAEIQLGMERVRARSLAMHKSEELSQVMAVMYQELEELHISPWGCELILCDEQRDALQYWSATILKSALPEPFNIPRSIHPLFDKQWNAWKKGKDRTVIVIEGSEKRKFDKLMLEKSEFRKYPLEIRKYIRSRKKDVYTHACFRYGLLESIGNEPLNDTDFEILMRFARVFEQSYTRFLDLTKAEAQAREAQIEAGLERVRAQAMAMHHSDDLGVTIEIFYEQLSILLSTPIVRCGAGLLNPENFIAEVVSASRNQSGKIAHVMGKTDMSGFPMLQNTYEHWKNQKDYHYVLKGSKIKRYYQFMTNQIAIPDYSKDEEQHFYFPMFIEGSFYIITKSELLSEELQAVRRFASVLSLTYRRFNDLQKAEAQAGEAKIESALERVRASSMAMHTSEEVGNATLILFEELEKIQLELFTCGLVIIHKNRVMETWDSTNRSGQKSLVIGRINMDSHPAIQGLFDAWKEMDKTYTFRYEGEDLEKFYEAIYSQSDFSFPKFEILPKRLFSNNVIIPEGALYAFTTKEITQEQTSILQRFAKVFSLTYRRYRDLQKAEAQAREAQIEAALEKVRSRSMAMHKSDELLDVITVVSEQLQLLNFRFNHVSFANSDFEKDYKFWTAAKGMDPMRLSVPHSDIAMFNHLRDAQQQCLSFFTDILTKQENRQWHKQLLKHSDDLFSEEENKYIMSRGMARSIALHPNIILILANYASVPYSEEENKIIARFGQVFEQSYTRFLDLQRAEAQAREARIEAALEKVRAKAMAMHSSEDLPATASVAFTELRKLGIEPLRSGVSIQNKENRKNLVYTAARNKGGDELSVVGWAMLDSHPVLSEIYDSWLRNEDYFPHMEGEVLRTYYEQIANSTILPKEHSETEQYGYFISFTHGMFYGWSETPILESDRQILKRFTSVVDLTFKRYFDLQNAEVQARDAIKRSSLDRIRGEIASMRTTTDLDRITPLIWKELNILNIPFIRCGVFIMDESKQQLHTFLSTPDGKAIAAFHLPYDAPGRTSEILAHWINKQVYINHWDETAFSDLGDLLVQQGALPSKDAYLSTVPKGGIYLHCLPFMQGMLYVGNSAKLNENDIHLIQSVADAFSTAYSRYEDFSKLEAAKQQVDKTLTDLKAAQSQLVQSEKMASLGELTAGIAHEIQNPLNFVNNFSEVSNELLVEMKEEIEKGNVEEVKLLAQDVIENLEKILHHGKRADGIVKGMLQHSRSSSGVKEPTDINALADEYLRLAYHGLRAKDKSFNSKFETDFDSNIGKVNVIPQDIGRVVLNLMTNAFYAVAERKKAEPEGYEPTVTVSTKREGGRILIAVNDNGNGIPESIKDKILQPFFTTKPTGQGTGLGLSLSYDIVKAHGGELRVESREGDGSEFTILLPFV